MGTHQQTQRTSPLRFRGLTALALVLLAGGCATKPPRTEVAAPPAGSQTDTDRRAEASATRATPSTPSTPGDHEPPADHPASPGPEVEQTQPPPPDPPKTDATPNPEPPRFESDLRGETHPGEVIPVDTQTKDGTPLDPSHLCDQRAADNEKVIDRTRRSVEEMVCTASMWFDGLFGDHYYLSDSREVYGTVELSNNWSQAYGNKLRLRFDAQVDLPNIDRRLSAFIGRDNVNDFIQDRFDNSALRNSFPTIDDHEKVFAGLGYSLPDKSRLRTKLRAGVRGFAHPEGFVQARAQLNAYADKNNLVNLRATPFWTTSDLLGITIGADYSHVLSEIMLLRFGNVGTWAQTTAGLDWRSTLTVYQALLGIKSGIAYEVFVRGETDDDVPIHDYGMQTTFRNPIFGGKLYTEWVLGYSYPRKDLDDHREGSILLGAAVQMPFGRQRER